MRVSGQGSRMKCPVCGALFSDTPSKIKCSLAADFGVAGARSDPEADPRWHLSAEQKECFMKSVTIHYIKGKQEYLYSAFYMLCIS